MTAAVFGEQFWSNRGLGDADAVGLGTINCTGGDRIAERTGGKLKSRGCVTWRHGNWGKCLREKNHAFVLDHSSVARCVFRSD